MARQQHGILGTCFKPFMLPLCNEHWNFLRVLTERMYYFLRVNCLLLTLPFSIKSEGLSLFLGFQKRGNFWRNPACSVFLWVWITSELNLFSECWSRSAGCRFEPKLQWLRDPCNQFHEQDVRNSTVHIISWLQIDIESTDFFNATCKTSILSWFISRGIPDTKPSNLK